MKVFMQKTLSLLLIIQILCGEALLAKSSSKKLRKNNIKQKPVSSLSLKKSPKKSQPQPQVNMSPNKLKSTSLQVSANVAQGSVLVDGILAGQINSKIDIQPGSHMISVSSPGYETSKIKFNIRGNQNNVLSVSLSKKFVPTPPPVKKQNNIALQNKKKQEAERENLLKPKTDLFKEADTKTEKISGRDLVREFEAESRSGYAITQQPQPPPPPRPVVQQPIQQPVQQPVIVQQQPMVQQQPTFVLPPMQQQPVYSYPAPQPLYQQPYANPYGGYAPPPTYQQPFYQPPIQQPYAPPPPPPAYTPNYSNGNGGGAIDAPYNYNDNSRNRSRRGKSSNKKSGSYFVASLPLGVGQYQNGSYLLGSLLTLTQLGAIGFGVYSYMESTNSIAEAQDFLKTAEAQPLSQEQKNTYIKEIEDYSAQQQNYAIASFAGFGILWVGGAIEAFSSMPTKRRQLSFEENKKFNLDLGIEPQENEPRVALKMDYKF